MLFLATARHKIWSATKHRRPLYRDVSGDHRSGVSVAPVSSTADWWTTKPLGNATRQSVGDKNPVFGITDTARHVK